MKKFCTTFFVLLSVILILDSQLLIAQCNPDTQYPVINYSPPVVNCTQWDIVQLEDSTFRNQLLGTANVTDNCAVATVEETYAVLDNACGQGTVLRTFTGVDSSGNTSSEVFIIRFEYLSDRILHLPADAKPGESPDTLTTTTGSCSNEATVWNDVEFVFDCDGDPDEFIRSFTTNDWCHPDAPIIFTQVFLPRLDIDGDNILGDAYDVKVTDQAAYLWVNRQLGDSIAPSSYTYSYEQHNDLIFGTPEVVTIQGVVYNDVNLNCLLESSEINVPNYQISVQNLVTGHEMFASSDAFGNYSLNFCADGDSIMISSYNPYNISGSCLSTEVYHLDSGTGSITIDLPVQIICPSIAVDLGALFLRRCMENRYFVSVFNNNGMSQDSVYVDVELDPLLDFVSASETEIDLGNNIYRFELGSMDPLETTNFWIDVMVDCDATLGQVHCSTAKGYPYEPCDTTNADWKGASLEVTGTCEGDSIRFQFKNIGQGNMDLFSNLIIVEDVIMLRTDPFILNAGDAKEILVPANGSTYHAGAEQVAFHPGRSFPSVTIEGCGGNNNPGLTLLFPQNDAEPNISIDCQENIGSYDPNDKQVIPAGLGFNRSILADINLEYRIRFQNTGTDTAFNVVIRDTLSQFVDASSIQPGVSSHDYTFQKIAANVIEFTFSDIMLPDSFVDVNGSQGFVKYNILQKVGNIPGDVIHSISDIYFDFNEPIRTNDAYVTIHERPYGFVTSVDGILNEESKFSFFPNPFQGSTNIVIDDSGFEEGELKIFNIQGVLQKRWELRERNTFLDLSELGSGVYYAAIKNGNSSISVHKIIVQ